MYQRFAFVVLTIAASIAASAKPAEVVYRTPFGRPISGAFYNFEDKISGARGSDIIWHFKTCPYTSSFDCLYIDEIGFALSVPKRAMPEGSTWRVGKFHFVVRHGGSMPFLGRNLNYTVIDMIVEGAPEGHAHIREAYDPNFGLVCYTYLNWKDRQTGKELPYETQEETACAEGIGLWPRRP